MKHTKKVLVLLCALLVAAAACSCKKQEQTKNEPVKENLPPVVEETPEENPAETPEEIPEQKPEDKPEETPEHNHTHVEEKPETKEELEALAAEALSKLETLPEYPAGYPTLEDVKAHYEKANMAVGWITSTEKIAVNSADTIIKNGLRYTRVRPDCQYGASELKKLAHVETEKLIYNLETLRAYYETLLCKQDAEDYMQDIADIRRFTEGDNGALYVIDFSYLPDGYTNDEEYSLTKINNDKYEFAVNYGVKTKDGGVKRHDETMYFIKEDGRWVLEDFRVIKQ